MHPPLNALRAFVLAARYGTFTAAAAELHVTQGAVSQQIARFEDYLGVHLFERRGAGLELTGAGRRLYRAVGNHLESIDRATAAVRDHAPGSTLGISTLTSFAAQWLMPRLAHFQKRHPDIRIRLETTLALLDLTANDMDCAIRFGNGQWPGLCAELLFEERLFPIATSAYAATLDLDRGPEVLKAAPLYYDTDGETEWPEWFRAAGVDGSGLNLTHGFTDSMVMMRALLAGGEGVALMRSGLVESELRDGSIVRLFGTWIRPLGSYFLVYPNRRSTSESFHAFREWLMSEAADYQRTLSEGVG